MIASRNASKVGGKGGRGGKSNFRGGRDSNSRNGTKGGNDRKSNNKSKPVETNDGSDPAVGEKRKRAVEPDGGPDVGVRGATIPVIASSKKAKTDESS